jgi:hypothetical protein
MQFAHLSISECKTYVLSDSQPVLWAMRTIKCAKGNVSKLQRWMIKLQSLDFEIILTHVKGQYNLGADALSRPWPMAFKVPDFQADDLKAYTIVSSFPIGTVVTLDMLDNYIRDLLNEGLNPVCSRDNDPNKYVRVVNNLQFSSSH